MTAHDVLVDIQSNGREMDQSPLTLAEEEDRVLERFESDLPREIRRWRQNPSESEEVGRLMPGMFPSSLEYTEIPRLTFHEGWNPDLSHTAPPWHPTCLSTRSPYPQFNLTPSESTGWEYWIHPDYLDKPYLYAKEPGSKFKFEVETVVGIIKVYSLRSRSFGLGIMECWLDGETSQSVKIEGYWDSDM